MISKPKYILNSSNIKTLAQKWTGEVLMIADRAIFWYERRFSWTICVLSIQESF